MSLRRVRSLGVFLDRHTPLMLGLGLAGIGLYQWRHWQQDKVLLAKVQPPPPLPPLQTWPDLPQVSVLVAAWNEAANIEAHIHSFLGLRYPNNELVLCAGGEDGTYELAQGWESERVKILRQEAGEGKQRALRRGLDHTTGSIVYLSDADCLLDDVSFERVVEPIACVGERATSGTSRPADSQLGQPFVVNQAASHLYSAYQSPLYVSGLLGRNCAVERSLLLQSAGLEAEAPSGTDYVLAKQLLRAGARIRQVPYSQIATEYPLEIRSYINQQRRWLRNALFYSRRYGSWGETLAALRNSLVGLGMLSLPILSLFAGRWVAAGWGLLFFQAWLSRLRYLAFFRSLVPFASNGRAALFQPAYLVLDFAAWSIPLLDLLRPPSRRTW